MEVTAADVKRLRDETGAGMMDAKRALVEANGDFEAAKQILREKGQSRAGKLSERSAEEGVVAATLRPGPGAASVGVMIELNCATDFVAKTENFTDLAADLADLVAEHKPATVDDLLALEFRSSNVSEVLNAMTSELGEPIRVRRFSRFENHKGLIDAYLHQPDPNLPPKVGVLIEVEGADHAGLVGPAREVSMHIAAMRPAYIARDDVPADEVDKERKAIEAQTRSEGKPDNVIPKIVEGRLKSFYETITLLDQPYVRDDKVTVGKFLGAIKVNKFVRYRVGGE
ncbi:MAG: translation elongation factor Ts [Actinomycetota bacterium]